MAELITDRHVVLVLRPFVRATTPLLDALRESDPLGLVRRVLGRSTDRDPDLAGADQTEVKGLESLLIPGTTAWHNMSVDDRDTWWVNRVGRFTVLMASIPGIGGALADRLPIQDTLATAGQGLVLSAIAAEHGADDPATRVRLIAHVLFARDITPEVAAGTADTRAAEDAATADMTTDLDESRAAHGGITPKAAAKTLWRFGRTLFALGDELDKRPQGRIYHRALGKLPILGAAGDYLGERSALKRAVKKGRKWLDTP
ncbi:hypothetical protein [Actinokineospora inagensis]|uniref:hypothetical protein n=1 Tax=Actinokineospora inagensis TaxID=103730 RepID=UPI0004226A27|nr:hypothetical protein [Actinokineospora inagensis]